MDFSKLNAQELAAKGATKSDFIGLDHKRLKGVSVSFIGELSKQGQKIKSATNRIIDGSKKVYSETERAIKVHTELAVGLVTAWDGIQWEGKLLECTEANRRMVFEEEGLHWFTAQVVAAIKDTSNFLSKADED